MFIATAPPNLLQAHRRDNKRTGKPARIVVLRPSVYSISQQYLQFIVQVIEFALLYLLVGCNYIAHQLRCNQHPLRSKSVPRCTSTASKRPYGYDALREANHRNLAVRPPAKTPIPHYDALRNLRRQPCNATLDSCPTYLNEMSLYRGYFVPGGVDPSGDQIQRMIPLYGRDFDYSRSLDRRRYPPDIPKVENHTSGKWEYKLDEAKRKYGHYIYARTMGVPGFISKLESFWWRNPLAVRTNPRIDSVARFVFKGDNALKMETPHGLDHRSITQGIIVHETIHYWNFKNGRYRRNGIKDEKMAYGVQFLHSGAFFNLSRFEREFIIDSDFKSVNCCSEAMKNEFKLAWEQPIIGIPAILTAHSGSHNGKEFTINEADWEEIEDITGIDISCEKVAEAYENYMRKHGLECDLECPDGIPEVFK